MLSSPTPSSNNCIPQQKCVLLVELLATSLWLSKLATWHLPSSTNYLSSNSTSFGGGGGAPNHHVIKSLCPSLPLVHCFNPMPHFKIYPYLVVPPHVLEAHHCLTCFTLKHLIYRRQFFISNSNLLEISSTCLFGTTKTHCFFFFLFFSFSSTNKTSSMKLGSITVFLIFRSPSHILDCLSPWCLKALLSLKLCVRLSPLTKFCLYHLPLNMTLSYDENAQSPML